MHEERFWTLASLRLSGEATPEELAELNEWCDGHPDWALRLEVYANIWRQQHPGLPVDKEAAYNKHFQRLKIHLAPEFQHLATGSLTGTAALSDQSAALSDQSAALSDQPAETSQILSTRPWWIASAVTAAAALGIFLLPYPFGRTGQNKIQIANNTVSTRPGSRSKVQLPDGTQVWLNADSRLTYNGNFSVISREVQLTGEAYFDVARDKDHPFLIHTSTVDIKVLGTSFNVRSYDNEKNTETALFQGSVQVSLHSHPEEKILLKPNQKLIVRNNALSMPGLPAGKTRADTDTPLVTLGKVHFQKKDSSITESLWMKNELAFDGASLQEVALQLERWYGVKVTVTDDRLNGIHYTAVFEDESLAQVMEALKLSSNFHYTIHKKEVTITP